MMVQCAAPPDPRVPRVLLVPTCPRGATLPPRSCDEETPRSRRGNRAAHAARTARTPRPPTREAPPSEGALQRMHVVITHVPALPEFAQDLAQHFGTRAAVAAGAPDVSSFELLRPLPSFIHGAARGTEYLVVTRWNSASCDEGWLRRLGAPRVDGASPASGAVRTWLTTHEVFEAAYGVGWQSRVQQAPQPLAVMNIIDVAQGHEAAFEEAFRTREGEVERQPGFLALEVLRPLSGCWEGPEALPAEPRATYLVFSRWESVKAHTAWTRSAAFRRAHGRRLLSEGAVLRAGVRAFDILEPASNPQPAEVGQ